MTQLCPKCFDQFSKRAFAVNVLLREEPEDEDEDEGENNGKEGVDEEEEDEGYSE